MPRPTLRCFLAVFPSADVRDRLARQIHRWSADDYPIKWVEPDNLHVTLKFLGQVAEGRHRHDRQGGRRYHGQSHVATRPGCGASARFPTFQRPRTIWAGFSAGREETRSLAESIEDCCSELGFKREQRRFSPHITLGRRQGHGSTTAAPDLRDVADLDLGEFPFEEVCLMSSNLRRTGPSYVRLATAESGEANPGTNANERSVREARWPGCAAPPLAKRIYVRTLKERGRRRCRDRESYACTRIREPMPCRSDRSSPILFARKD